MTRTAAAVALAALVGAGCADRGADGGASGRGAGWEGETTVENGVTVVRNTGRGAWARDTVVARQEWTIGEIEGAPEYLFGAITGVAEDRQGRLYVTDRLAGNVRVYGTDGRHLLTIGREGEGPGEFAWPTAPTPTGDGRLIVRDTRRISVFAAAAAAGDGDVPDRFVESWTGPVYGSSHARASPVTEDGTYLYPYQLLRVDSPPRHFFLRFRDGVEQPDTLHVPPYAGSVATSSAFYMVSAGTGRMVPGLSRAPFAPAPAWTATPAGTVVGGDGSRYELIETGLAGDTLRRIVRVDPAPAIPAGERRDSTAALRARIDSLPVPLADVRNVSDDVRAGRVPTEYPPYLAVHAATDGRIWVRRWPRRAGESIYDVFERDGVFLGTVTAGEDLAAEPPPWFTGDTITGVVIDAETDVGRVVRFRIDPPGTGM
jgi:hypothetical protein